MARQGVPPHCLCWASRLLVLRTYHCLRAPGLLRGSQHAFAFVSCVVSSATLCCWPQQMLQGCSVHLPLRIWHRWHWPCAGVAQQL